MFCFYFGCFCWYQHWRQIQISKTEKLIKNQLTSMIFKFSIYLICIKKKVVVHFKSEYGICCSSYLICSKFSIFNGSIYRMKCKFFFVVIWRKKKRLAKKKQRFILRKFLRLITRKETNCGKCWDTLKCFLQQNMQTSKTFLV